MQMLEIYYCHFIIHNMMVCGQVRQALGGHAGAYKGCCKPYWGFYSLCAVVTNPISVFHFLLQGCHNIRACATSLGPILSSIVIATDYLNPLQGFILCTEGSRKGFKGFQGSSRV